MNNDIHFYDATTVQPQTLLTHLAHHGLVFLDNLSHVSMVRISRDFLGHILVQDDTDEEGVKTVDPDAAMNGSALHTDRSNMARPPSLVMIGVLSQSRGGGETILCDGKHLAQALMQDHPEAWKVFRQPHGACFGQPGFQTLQSIFESCPMGYKVRFRQDRWGFYSPDVWANMPLLNQLIAQHQWSIRLKAGQGYLVHNTRWLHGAMAGEGGQRHVLRTMIVPDGFDDFFTVEPFK